MSSWAIRPALDFETKILVKEDAPELLRAELSSPKWRPRVLALSGVTDPYQPLERRMGLTRRCLSVLAEFRQAVSIITKNRLVTRDIDLLGELARHGAAGVFLSITTLDPELAGRLEPRTTRPAGRLEAIARLTEAGIPAGVMVAPLIPGLTEHEMPAILEAAAEAGARSAGYTLVRLPLAVAPLFEDWLGRHYPDRKDKVLERIRAMRAGPAQRLALRRPDGRRGAPRRDDRRGCSARPAAARGSTSSPGPSRPPPSAARGREQLTLVLKTDIGPIAGLD